MGWNKSLDKDSTAKCSKVCYAKNNVHFIRGHNIKESHSKTSMGHYTMLKFCLGDFTKSLRAKVAQNQRHIVTQWRLVNLPPVCLPNLNYQSNVSVVGLGASVNHMDEPMWFPENKCQCFVHPRRLINIEPENDGLEHDFPLPGVYSQVSCQSSKV